MGNSRGTDGIQGSGETVRGHPVGSGPEVGPPETERAADLAAVERCLAGDRAAFTEIVARWQDRIYAAVYRMTRDEGSARDLAQETFLKAWSSLRSFQGGAALGTWLYSIALNQVRSDIRHRKAQKRGAPISLDAPQGDGTAGIDPMDGSPGAEDAAATREHVLILRAAVAELDPEHREVIVLREFQDQTYEEISATLDIPVGTVRSRLFRAREDLRRRLEGKVLP